MNKRNWDFYAPIYDLFMKKDSRAYKQMYMLINKKVRKMRRGD